MASAREAYEMGNGPQAPDDVGPYIRAARPAYRPSVARAAPTERPMPSKEPVQAGDRIRPSVPLDVARVAAYLTTDTVIRDIFQRLRDEAVEKLTASPLGTAGINAREVARYELEALSTIESRLQSMAAEVRLHRNEAE